MPVQSRPIPTGLPILSREDINAMVPFIHPELRTDSVMSSLIQTSPFAIKLDLADIHIHSADGKYGALDVDVAAAIWSAIKRIARTIVIAANPNMDPRDLRPVIPFSRLREIDMPPPFIIKALGFTQNPCLLSGTTEDIIGRFEYIQHLGVEGLRWLLHARARCDRYPNNWKWTTSSNETFMAHPALTNGPIPLQEDRMLDHFAPVNLERALILHPTMSNAARANPSAFPPFHPTSPSSTTCTPPSSGSGSDSEGTASTMYDAFADVDMDKLFTDGVTYTDDDGREIIDLTVDEDIVMADV